MDSKVDLEFSFSKGFGFGFFYIWQEKNPKIQKSFFNPFFFQTKLPSTLKICFLSDLKKEPITLIHRVEKLLLRISHYFGLSLDWSKIAVNDDVLRAKIVYEKGFGFFWSFDLNPFEKLDFDSDLNPKNRKDRIWILNLFTKDSAIPCGNNDSVILFEQIMNLDLDFDLDHFIICFNP